ncbi:MAG: ATP-binding protein [Pseudomonadota bacterium]
MFIRQLTKQLQQAVSSFYAVCLAGPRQSGKTTLLKKLFPKHSYVNLESPDNLAMITADPRGFFADSNKLWIIDEAQEYPKLFSYLLDLIDSNKVKGQFILSGSKNFILLEKISQSLAGRIAVLELLPLTYRELLSDNSVNTNNVWQYIYQGSYPGPYHLQQDINLWYKSYIATYLQRDVRQLIKIKDLTKFHLFLKLCAARHGHMVNLSDISSSCGVSHTTIGEWLNLLELSYIIFRLPPYFNNFNKRLVKTPKLYFYDPGLVCHLLGIESAEHAKIHASRGALFEGCVISEVIKNNINNAKSSNCYFWHHNKGFEIDLLITNANKVKAVEIKSSATFNTDFTKQPKKWLDLTQGQLDSELYVTYSGDDSFSHKNIKVISWREIDSLS